jgi:hypothetical protein
MTRDGFNDVTKPLSMRADSTLEVALVRVPQKPGRPHVTPPPPPVVKKAGSGNGTGSGSAANKGDPNLDIRLSR